MAGLKLNEPRTSAAETEISPDQHGNVVLPLKDGRRVTFRKVPLSRRLRIIGLLGDDAHNPLIATMAVIASCVTEVAGELASPPTSRAQIDAILDRLEDDAITEIGVEYNRLFGNPPINGDALGNS